MNDPVAQADRDREKAAAEQAALEAAAAKAQGKVSASARIDPTTGKPIPESVPANSRPSSGQYRKPDTDGDSTSVDQAGTVTQRDPSDPGPMQANPPGEDTAKPEGFWQQVGYVAMQWLRIMAGG